MVEDGSLRVDNLEAFFSDYLEENGQLEAVFCRAGYTSEELSKLNARFSALRPGRESRAASLKLGRRFLHLAGSLLKETFDRDECHLCIAFGLVGRTLALDGDLVCAAYLHQSIFGQLSACQRLLPLGQTRASELLWNLKPRILAAVENSKSQGIEEVWCCQSALEIGSMRHPLLPTRLFIS